MAMTTPPAAAFLLGLFLASVPCHAQRAEVLASPLPGDRAALERLFETGAPRLPVMARPEMAGRPPVPGVPARSVSFHGAAIPAYVFSREHRPADTLVAAIDKTTATLDLALYVLNLPDVTDAVVRAHQERKVKVRVVLDYGAAYPGPGKARSSEITKLAQAGIPIRTLRGEGYGIMHNKIGLYDRALLTAGSFNWTVPANTRHFENLVARDDPALIAVFQAYWDWMWSQGMPMDVIQTPAAAQAPPAPGGPQLSYKGRPWPSIVFSPKAGSTRLLVEAIDKAERMVDIAMFSFYSQELGEAVVRAKERGLKVRVVMDRGQGRNTPIKKLLLDAGVDLRLSSGIGGQGVLHHKFALFDRELLETGSFNYSNNAEFNNYENAIFSTDSNDLQGFSAEFEFLYQQGTSAASASSGA